MGPRTAMTSAVGQTMLVVGSVVTAYQLGQLGWRAPFKRPPGRV